MELQNSFEFARLWPNCGSQVMLRSPAKREPNKKAKQGAESSQPEVPLSLRRAKSVISTYIDKCTSVT
ncbi:hypothetical protein TNCV_568481 [Trichonephila clavipes]|nr:hypothetical protein TNCV_568481 [Trichonephila clavipes]